MPGYVKPWADTQISDKPDDHVVQEKHIKRFRIGLPNVGINLLWTGKV